MAKRNYDIRYTTTPCRWALDTSEVCPHTREEHKGVPKICDTILDAIGHTPIVRINTLTKQEGVECELLVKCEYLNPGGSVKDRVGARIISDLERSGRLRPGMTIVEPTSGNTGIGLAMSATVKGYPLVICLPEKMSQEKSDTLSAMGAKIIRTPTEAGFNSENSYVGVAERLEKENPEVIMAGQYFNPSNPLAHYDHTAEEIFDQCEGKLDYIVVGSGTGGQITGLSRKLKEKIPGLVVVGVDPKGSIINDPVNAVDGSYKAEGMGSSIVPRSCNTGLVDQWYIIDDQESFDYARKLIRYEGLLVGGSSGTVICAALKLAKTLPPGKRVLTVLPDSVRNYMSKFLNDRWMIQNGFLKETETEPVQGKTIKDLNIPPCITLNNGITVREVIQVMVSNNITEIPIVSNGKILGVASSNVINKKIVAGNARNDDLIDTVLVKNLKYLHLDTSLAFLSVWLEDWKYAVVQDDEFIGVIYPIHLSNFLANI
jgi:cystathionine beta-synthase